MKEGRKIAVIAGTPVDTGMGVKYLVSRSMDEQDILGMPASDSCDEQVKFQYSSNEHKRARMDEIFDAAIAGGVRDFFIYCNSLSGSFDFDRYEREKSQEISGTIRIFTPLQVYRRLGAEFTRIGVMAANNLSVHAIEEELMGSNPDIYVIGSGNMTIVRAIEDGLSPEEIVAGCRLAELAAYMEASGAEALILGCTHFPYFREELAGVCGIPIIDPADEMYKSLSFMR